MLEEYQIEELADGVALLKYEGCLYKCVGTGSAGKLTFRALSGDVILSLTYTTLLRMPGCEVVY